MTARWERPDYEDSMPTRYQTWLSVVEITFAEPVPCDACGEQGREILGLVTDFEPAVLAVAYCSDDCMLDDLHARRLDSPGHR